MLDVVARVARAQLTTYTLPKSVFIQFVGAHPSRRDEISLRLTGMKGDGTNLGHQQVRNQSERDVYGNLIGEWERIKEVFWWKYVGVTLQGDLKHERMVDQMVRAAEAKAGALGTYLCFAGGLTPEVQMLVASAVIPGTMLYAAPAWCGVGEGSGATKTDMKRLGRVWDGVLRSTFGCMKKTHGACMRAEAGWTSFDLECARHVALYYRRVQQMKDDVIDDRGTKAVRPVKALLMELVGSHARLPGYVPNDNGMGAKVCKALKMVLGEEAENALRGEFTSKNHGMGQ